MAINRSFQNMLNDMPVSGLSRVRRPGRLRLKQVDFNRSIKQSIWKRLASLGGKE